MDQFKVIKVLPKTGSLPIPLSNDVKRMVQVYEDMTSANLTDSNLLRLVALNPDNLGFLIKCIPLPQLLRLYEYNGIFHNYLTPELVD